MLTRFVVVCVVDDFGFCRFDLLVLLCGWMLTDFNFVVLNVDGFALMIGD